MAVPNAGKLSDSGSLFLELRT